MAETRYVALLKGINVGKAKRVAMADLRTILNDLGYRDVVTHLQSGNAVFNASGPATEIGSAVAAGLLGELGVEVKVVVRTHAQIGAAIAADPFGRIADDPAKHLLGFFSTLPAEGKLVAFEEMVEARHIDPAVGGLHGIVGDHCYLWCPQGSLRSLFGTVDWDRQLGVTVTMRNWTTSLKLLQLSA